MDSKEILIKIRELLADPKHWTKGSYARVKKGGESTSYDVENATCWCLMGALNKVVNGVYDSSTIKAKNLLQSCLPIKYLEQLIEFNDNKNTKHAQIIKALDCAIEKAE